ncbi:aaa family atpase [Candidatus Magnetomorum sp. HK-1]|nr:aaa family atpase [Candidatus Magnetomorum sp. HK-1]
MVQYDQIIDQNPWWIQAKYLPVEASWPHRNLFSTLSDDLSKNLIQLITGLRRVGKSTLLKQIISLLLKEKVAADHILYFSFDKHAIDKNSTSLEALIDTYLSRRLKKRVFEISDSVYLLIDEIQYIDFWQDILKRYYDMNKLIKFIISGSQSTKLQGKSKESLAGRLIEYNASVLSIDEYLSISGLKNNYKTIWDCQLTHNGFHELYDYHYENHLHLEERLPAYLCYGQFPETLQYAEDIKFGYEYIKESVLGKILEIDIPAYYSIEKVNEFKLMAYHLLTNSSSFYELQNIGRELGISKATSEKYFSYLKNAYIIDVLYKYTKSNIKKGRSLKKAYAKSTNFITAINNYQLQYYEDLPEIFGKIIETYVWQRLISLFDTISLWRKGNREIDFIITNQGDSLKTILVEVKFKNKIRNNEIKYLFSHAADIGCQSVIVVTKSTMEIQTISGIDAYFIPFYLI